MLPSALAQSCGNGPRHLVYALVYSREYKKDLILMCMMSQLRTVFFVFALFEPLTLSERMQYRNYRQYYASDMGAHRGGHDAMAHPLWLCNKVLKPNFKSIISQTTNGCSLLSHILAKLLLLDINFRKCFCIVCSDCQ